MSNIIINELLIATWQTLYMVFIAGFFGILGGLALGALLFVTGKKQALENEWVHRSLSFIVNVTRSIPFIILMIAVIPLTHLLIGTTIGTNAAIVPLIIAAIPFFARVCENALAGVSAGLMEAAYAMGASNWQIISKILMPESLPALIRGATLTLIGLVGYSAMAGAIGGGGLGELAINYGYQQFDTPVLTATVIILIVMVQLIQWLGDKLAHNRNLKAIILGSLCFWIASGVYILWPAQTQSTETLRIGIMSGQSEKVLAAAKKIAMEKYNVQLEVVTFSDYVQPNTALANGSIDANIFQHEPYLAEQIKSHHYPLAILTKTFVYPMGFYSRKIRDINQLKRNAIVAIPNDPSNSARALLLLQKFKLISLKSGVGTLVTINDIIANPFNLQFKLLDAAQIPRALNDVDLAAITNDFTAPAGLSIKDAILKEGSDSLYANIVVIREEDKNNPAMKKLIDIMHSDAVRDKTETLFPDGAAVPAW